MVEWDHASALRPRGVAGARGCFGVPARINLVLYYGVLAPRAAWRQPSWHRLGRSDLARRAQVMDVDEAASERRRRRGYLWADLMRRTFGLDVLACPRCCGRLRLIALIEDARVVERILRHLGLPTDRPEPRLARAPPDAVFDWRVS